MGRFPNLEELPLFHRACLVVVIMVLVIFFLFLAIVLLPDDHATGEEQPVNLSKYEAQFIALDKAAIDEAYKKHIGRLFETWTTDYDAKGPEPPRAVRGALNARSVYTRSMDAIERRAERLKNGR
jgi:hypothetical protein